MPQYCHYAYRKVAEWLEYSPLVLKAQIAQSSWYARSFKNSLFIHQGIRKRLSSDLGKVKAARKINSTPPKLHRFIHKLAH